MIKEDRHKIWDEYPGHKNSSMQRMFLEYNRYFEAKQIKSVIDDILEGVGGSWKDIKVLDYGCGVADYGIFFARLGSFVRLLDIDSDAISFAGWRMGKEKFSYGVTNSPVGYDLVIFGEVLDHLPDPLGTMQLVVDSGAKYIFTSSYPYRSDDPNDAHWQHDHHLLSAFQQQPKVRKLLEKYYDKINFGGQRNLWIRK